MSQGWKLTVYLKMSFNAASIHCLSMKCFFFVKKYDLSFIHIFLTDSFQTGLALQRCYKYFKTTPKKEDQK